MLATKLAPVLVLALTALPSAAQTKGDAGFSERDSSSKETRDHLDESPGSQSDSQSECSSPSQTQTESEKQTQAQAQAQAQAQSQTPPEVKEHVFVEGSLPYVPNSSTIVSKLPLAPRLTPANVGIVTEPVIREQYARTVSDALTNVSNVNVQSQSGIHDFFLIRGFDSLSSGLVLTDGAPEPEATFYQLYNVERVEVLKGPAGFLYGSNPLSGAVNLVRKQPLPASFFDLGGVVGSFDTFEGFLDWNHGSSSGDAAIRVNALVRDQGSHRPDKGGQTLALNPSFWWRPDDASRLNVSLEYMDVDFIPDAGIPVLGDTLAGVDLDTSYQTPFDTSQQDVLRLQVDYEREVNDWLTIRDKFYHRDLDWISTGTILNGVIPTGPQTFGVARTLGLLEDRQGFTGNQLEAIASFTTGDTVHHLLAGLEISRFADEFTLDAEQLNIVDLFQPVDPTGGMGFPIPGVRQTGDARSVVFAPYVIDQMQVTSEFQVLVGGRIDRIDFQDAERDFDRTDTEFSPMIGALYAPDDRTSFYGNVSRSFAPSSPRVVEQRLPEKSTQYEVGIKNRLPGLGAEFTVALYHLERENIAIPDDNGFTQQVGNQRSRGLEIDVSVQPDPFLRGFFSYAFNSAVLTNFAESVLVSFAPPSFATLDRSGNRPAFAPKHIFNFWVSKDIDDRWTAGGGGRYLGEQFIAEDNAFALDGVFTIDAMVSYRIAGGRIRLNLKNLTDQQTYTRGFGSISVIPGTGFGAFVGFDYRF